MNGDNTMEKRIFWAGDSTVKQNDYTSFPQTGMGQAFGLFIARNVRIENYAQNGRSTKSFIDEGRLDAIDRKINEGDFLFIQFGHNDEKEDVARHTDAYGDYQENLIKFIDIAKKHNAHPVLITSLYRRVFNTDGKTLVENTHLEYPQAMIELGERLNVPVIDLCAKSKKLIEEAGTEVSKEWFNHVSAGIYPNFPDGKADNSHLRYEGAYRFCMVVAEELKQLGGIYKALLLDPDEDGEDPALLLD